MEILRGRREEVVPVEPTFAVAGQVVASIVTEVTFRRLTGAALMNSPFTSTVWPLWLGKSNSEMPIS